MAAQERTQRGKRKGSVTVAVKVKFNPEDLSRIYVFNYVDNQYYELKCTDPAYAEGTSLWQHREIRKFAVAQANGFRTPEQRREMRLALARRIADTAPEIGLKRKRDQKKLEDAFANDLEALDQVEDLGDNGIRVTPAAASRADGGRPQHSPQRGKSARRRNAAKRKARTPASKPAHPTPALVAMTEELRTAAEAGWRAN
jgi:putative transposase